MRPSRILRVFDEWAAYQLDGALLHFGRAIENQLSELDKDGKPKNRLADLLGIVREVDAVQALNEFSGIPGAVRTRRGKSKVANAN